MKAWSGEQVHLIYLDPPFNSNQDYNVLYGHDEKRGRTAQRQAFSDTWRWDTAAQERVERLKQQGIAQPLHGLISNLEGLLSRTGMLAYLSYMAERIAECHRLLKPTGSIYVHCDDAAVHYLKVVMDSIFGAERYRNQLIWKRTSSHSDARRYGRIHDVVLFYSKSDQYTWNPQFTPLDPKNISSKYRHDDNDGRGLYRRDNLTGPAHGPNPGGESAQPWQGFDVAGTGRVWSVPKTGEYANWIENYLIPDYRSIEGVHDRLDRLSEAGLVYWTRNGTPELKRYLASTRGNAPCDVITDISPVNSQASERIGYDTQKPLDLMDRIIRSSSNKGDLVVDPFGGCGTTVIAAHQAGRRWAGIDIGVEALDVTKNVRLNGIGVYDVMIHGIPIEVESARLLAKTDSLAFERWAVQLIPGMIPNDKQIGDRGIDGRGEIFSSIDAISGDSRVANAGVLAQVSASTSPSLSKIRDFCRVLNREGAALGIFITIDSKSPSKSAREEAQEMGSISVGDGTTQYPRLQFWSIANHYAGSVPNLPPLRNPHTGRSIENKLF